MRNVRLAQSVEPWLAIAWAVAFLLAMALFTTGYFTHAPGELSVFLADSGDLVVKKLAAGLDPLEEWRQFGFFMHNVYQGEEIAYASQSGLQGNFYYAGYLLLGRPDLATYLVASRFAVSFAYALALALICQRILASYHPFTPIMAFVGISTSLWIVRFAAGLYWIPVLSVLPLLAAWMLYPGVIRGERAIWTFYVVIAGLLCLKALAGYEYITNIILLPTVAVLFFSLREQAPISTLARRVFLTTLSGIIGFTTAFGFHMAQAALFAGRRGLDFILSRASARTHGAPECSPSDTLLLDYFGLPVFPGMLDFITIGLLVVSWLLLTVALLFLRRFDHADETLILAITTGWALLCSLSWYFSAYGHMLCHLHLNAITFFWPFGILLWSLVAASLVGLPLRILTK